MPAAAIFSRSATASSLKHGTARSAATVRALASTSRAWLVLVLGLVLGLGFGFGLVLVFGLLDGHEV